MKTLLKTIFAWLDWSTYCRSGEGGYSTSYEFPQSICPLFWRTLFSIVALPVTWITHIWNILFVKIKYFRDEDYASHKLNWLNTILFTIVIFIAGFGGSSITDGKDGSKGLGWDWFHMADPFLINYFKLIGVGIIMLAIIGICLAIVIGIGYLIYLAVIAIRDYFTDSTWDSEDNYIPSEERMVNKTIDAIKNKYCPKIDWGAIRSKKE